MYSGTTANFEHCENLNYYNAGDIVEIIKIQKIYDRYRGLLKDHNGWITLYHRVHGTHFASKLK